MFTIMGAEILFLFYEIGHFRENREFESLFLNAREAVRSSRDLPRYRDTKAHSQTPTIFPNSNFTRQSREK